MSGRSSKNKGSSGERELVKKLQELGVEAERTLFQPSKDNPRPDVRTNIKNTSWECKRVEKLSLWAALKQTEKAAKENERPVLAFRRNNTSWKVAIDLDYFIELLKDGNRLHEYF